MMFFFSVTTNIWKDNRPWLSESHIQFSFSPMQFFCSNARVYLVSEEANQQKETHHEVSKRDITRKTKIQRTVMTIGQGIIIIIFWLFKNKDERNRLEYPNTIHTSTINKKIPLILSLSILQMVNDHILKKNNLLQVQYKSSNSSFNIFHLQDESKAETLGQRLLLKMSDIGVVKETKI